MNRLPTEVVYVIYKFVHKNMIKDLNEQFKKFVNHAKFYHVLQEYGKKCFLSHELSTIIENLDFTECCFRYPRSIKFIGV